MIRRTIKLFIRVVLVALLFNAAFLCQNSLADFFGISDCSTGEIYNGGVYSYGVDVKTPIDIQRHWACDQIYTMMKTGLISGYETGRFRPDRVITRQEMAVMLYRLADYQDLDMALPEYEDTPQVWELPAWAKSAAAWNIKNDIVGIYSDGTFRGDWKVDRGMMAWSIYNYLRLEGKELSGNNSCELTDIKGHYAEEPIRILWENGIVSGYPDGTYKPNGTVTRAEIATILRRIGDFQLVYGERNLPEKRVISTPYISQLYPYNAVVGCEGTSLLMGLKAKGYAKDVDLKTFLDAMPKHASNPEKGFVGSPYMPDRSKKTRTTIFPEKLAEYGSSYGTVRDISGCLISELQDEVLAGNPVVAYCTMHWEKPYYRTYNVEGVQKTFLSNNHVILVAGYDSKTNSYYIMDPYNFGTPHSTLAYWKDGGTFESIFKARSHAVVIE